MENSTPTSGRSGASSTAPASASRIKIAPSILSADFGRLAEEVAAVERGGAEIIHIDVMDGHFVPNLTVGPAVVASLRRHTNLPLDCHLMVEDPASYAPRFVEAGADMVSFHVEVVTGEACRELARSIRGAGAEAGLVINPDTSVSDLAPYLNEVDYILVMSVYPGFSGQKFMPVVRPKVREVAAAIREGGLAVEVQIDGGIGAENVVDVVEDGATLIVAGSSIFNGDPERATEELKRLADTARR